MVTPKFPVFIFAGPDSYSKEQAIAKLSNSVLDGSSKELNHIVFDGAESRLSDILDCVSTVPFMAAKRLVVVKNFDKLSDEDKVRLMKYARTPNKHTYLVIDSKDDSILKDNPDVMRYTVYSRFGELTDSQFQSRVTDMLLSSKKSISADAARALKELYNDDMGSVSRELEKLSSFVGERSAIETSDIEAVAGKHINASAFDLTDAIEVNDLNKSLSIVSELILSGKKHYEILGLLCWQMKRLFKGRALLENGTPEQQIAGILRINRRYHGRFFKQVKASTLEGVEAKINTLLETDLDIKRSRYDPAIALEFAVIKLCLGLR